jgi:hypothetical protein
MKKILWTVVFASFAFSAGAYAFCDRVQSELSKHEVQQATDVLTKGDLDRFEGRLDKRLSSIDTKLDRKVDKP